MPHTLRIGNGCGFWGDNLDAPLQLAEHGKLDYLTLEYLAELTMSILALLKSRDAQAGYAHDFLDVLQRLTPFLKRQPGLKIITNAGGMNPSACAAKASEMLKKEGVQGRKIGIVAGDDLLPRLDELLKAGHPLTNLDTGQPFEMIRAKVVSANAYLGSAPIAQALKLGASIVVTGRVADACLTVGPCLHEFGWKEDDWDRLCAGSAAGHVIECGAQATGGLYTRWTEVPDYANIGYPIAEIQADGTCWIDKPPGTGGLVNVHTVSEQLLYEVGDPASYFTPDVTADFTSLKLHDEAGGRVRIDGAKGRPASDSYKVSIAYRNGFTSAGTLVFFGADAAAKAQKSGEILLEKLKRIGVSFERSQIEVIGAGSVVPGVKPKGPPPLEVMLRVAVHDKSKASVERFTKEFAPLVTSGLPGTAGYTTGRAAVREVFAYWPALLKKSAVQAEVRLLEEHRPAAG